MKNFKVWYIITLFAALIVLILLLMQNDKEYNYIVEHCSTNEQKEAEQFLKELLNGDKEAKAEIESRYIASYQKEDEQD